MAAEDVAGDLGGKTLPARQREVHRATHRRRDAAGGAAVHRASKVRSGLRWPLLLVAMPFAPTSDVPVQVSRIVFQLGSKSIFSSVGVISDCYQ